MMTCERNTKLTETPYTEIIGLCPYFITLTEKDVFLYITTTGAEMQTKVAQFIKDHCPHILTLHGMVVSTVTN